MEILNFLNNEIFYGLFFGCFVQVATILLLLRVALGLSQFDLGIVTVLLSLAISVAFVDGRFNRPNTSSFSDPAFKAELRTYMQEHSEPKIMDKIATLTGPAAGQPADSSANSNLTVNSEPSGERLSLNQVQAAFLLSQFQRAIGIGLILIIPLFLIDFMVSFSLTLVGAQSMPVQTIAIPLKLILLVAMDAWDMIVGKLLSGLI